MTTRGRGRVGQAVFGSVAADVIREVATPVVLVGPECDPGWPTADGPILVCVDGSAASDAILPVVRDWAPALGVGVVIVHAFHPLDVASAQEPNEVVERSTSALGGVVGEVRSLLVRSEYPAGTILDAAAAVGASTIAMATHGRGGIARLVLGSVATGVVHRSPVPVLSVRPG